MSTVPSALLSDRTNHRQSLQSNVRIQETSPLLTISSPNPNHPAQIVGFVLITRPASLTLTTALVEFCRHRTPSVLLCSLTSPANFIPIDDCGAEFPSRSSEQKARPNHRHYRILSQFQHLTSRRPKTDPGRDSR